MKLYEKDFLTLVNKSAKVHFAIKIKNSYKIHHIKAHNTNFTSYFTYEICCSV